jgi:hypothetical protein
MRRFSFAQVRHYSFAVTHNVEAISRCRGGSYLEMSGFDVEFDCVFNGFESHVALKDRA